MSITTKAVVEKIVPISENIREYLLKPEKIASYEPGQFLQLSLDILEASDYWNESRTFSIASYNKQYLRLIIKKVGKYTTRIFEELKQGSMLTIKYAYGDFLLPFDYDEIVFIAGGTGISPILSFIDKIEDDNQLDKIKLFYSAKMKNELIDYDRILKLLGKDKAKFYLTCENLDCENIIKGRIKIEDITKNTDRSSNIYICGSRDFIGYFKKVLEEKDYKSIIVDEW